MCLLVADLHEAFRWLRATRVPERLGFPADLLSAALAFFPTLSARARCR
jgi:hypothetical protein